MRQHAQALIQLPQLGFFAKLRATVCSNPILRANLLRPGGTRKGATVEQTGEYRIAAARDVVWRGLNDPEVLARCIDGCEAMTRVNDQQFDARVKARIGPVSAVFQAQLNLEDVVPSNSYTINASVKGGPAGFGKGRAEVQLADDGEATLLRYAVKGSVGGKLAQVGSRLIDGAARKMADDFFLAFGREISGAEPVSTAAEAASAAPTYETGGQWKIWLIVIIALVIALVLAF
ncbi:MAG: carbon monoxide dehydrogenase subunit G [Pseudomonadales bacterium]